MNTKEPQKEYTNIYELLKFSREMKQRLTTIVEETIKSEYNNSNEYDLRSAWKEINSMLSICRLIEICNAIENLAELQKTKPIAYMVFDETYNEVITYKGNEQLANKVAENYNSSSEYCCKVIPLYSHPEK
ncbi:hypothetical protein [Xenorhabdus griffiniae]|uniref:hypothetical protein n=1 Tax=Xenorhabdus griffiniae TaxID=351672 RepID=UPI00235A189F|nr:hypothetical protein [Xenorhabdus griffiniae]MDC9607127.1 hypothetical protein [Xenorhabdus griffiniae]